MYFRNFKKLEKIKIKKILLAATAMTLLFTACKKKDDNSGLGANQIKIAGTTYSATISAGGSTLTGGGTNGTSVATFGIDFSGSSLPTTSGTYKIVDVATATDEVSVYVAVVNSGSTTASSYGSKASNTATATVTVNSGKVTVSIPDITLDGSTGTTGTATFSANVTQP